VSAAIGRLSSRYPLITFQVTQADPRTLFRYLDERKVEIVLTRMSDTSVEKHMKADILYDDPVFVVAGLENQWTRRRKIALPDLVNERWVLYPPDTMVGGAIAKAFRDSGVEPPRATVITLSVGMRASLLATGHFLSMLPGTALQFSAKHAAIRALPIDLPATRQPVGLINAACYFGGSSFLPFLVS
jgi:DNA-binding transcriptional LysR family regulator